MAGPGHTYQCQLCYVTMSEPGNDPELFDNLGTFASGENARDHQLGVTF